MKTKIKRPKPPGKPKLPRLEIKKSGKSKEPWRTKIWGGNGELIHRSEGYSSKAHAEKGLVDLFEALDALLFS